MSANAKGKPLFYMDGLKVYARNDKEFHELPSVVKVFRDTTKFNPNKCAKLCIKRGKYCSSNSIHLDADTTIKDMDQHDTYKYLGTSENAGINHKIMKVKISKEYFCRILMVLNSQLSSQNKFKAINTFAMPTITYSFSIVNWSLSEIRKLDSKTRKLLTCNKAQHPKSDVDRLYLNSRTQ